MEVKRVQFDLTTHTTVSRARGDLIRREFESVGDPVRVAVGRRLVRLGLRLAGDELRLARPPGAPGLGGVSLEAGRPPPPACTHAREAEAGTYRRGPADLRTGCLGHVLTGAGAQSRAGLSSSQGFLSGAVAQLICSSPSQQPSFSLQWGHCQVPCTQDISTPHRQHASELTRAI
jgi:hypothetical protein